MTNEDKYNVNSSHHNLTCGKEICPQVGRWTETVEKYFIFPRPSGPLALCMYASLSLSFPLPIPFLPLCVCVSMCMPFSSDEKLTVYSMIKRVQTFKHMRVSSIRNTKIRHAKVPINLSKIPTTLV